MVVYLNELHKCKSSSPLDLCLNFPQMGGKFSYIQTNEFEYRGVELKFYLTLKAIPDPRHSHHKQYNP